MDYIPQVDSPIKLESLKHDQSLHRRWEENTVLFADERVIIGANNRTTVVENDETWITKTPALFYFEKEKWFNVIYLFKESRPFYYCNLISPYSLVEDKIQYVDYDIDFFVQPDYSYSIVDRDEYAVNKERYHYPKQVQEQLRKAEAELKRWIKQRKDPFNRRFLRYWQHKMDKVMN